MQFGLFEAVAHWGQYRGRNRAIVANGEPISYADLNTAVDVISRLACDDATDRIAIATSSKLDLLVGILGMLKVGKSTVMLQSNLPEEALEANLVDSATNLLLHDGSVGELVRIIRGLGGCDLDMAATNGKTSRGNYIPRKPTDEWGVLFSSGTTGVPKGIARDHNSMVTEFLGWIVELGLCRNTSFYIGRPIFYTGGLVLAAATLLAGGTIVFDDLKCENDSEEMYDTLCRALNRESIDWVFLIPDQVRALIKSKLNPQLRYWPKNILVMGGVIHGEEKLALSKLFHCNVIESWGNSESLGTITEPEDLVKRPNSIGRPFVGDELMIVDENLHRLPAFEKGRIAGGIEAGFNCYCNRPEQTQKVRRDGLILSEDYGYQDEDGYFYILGRVSDNIVRAGQSIFLSAVEAQIRSMENVGDCCVIAVGDVATARLVALVSMQTPTSPPHMLHAINLTLSECERIDSVIFLDLPRVPSGKIDRAKCRIIAENWRDGDLVNA